MRLIDADALIEDIKRTFEGVEGDIAKLFVDISTVRIEEAQTMNESEYVPVVRCKDCRHRYEEGDCTHYYWCRLHDRPIDNDNFCSWGERREE